jgi:membrane-associated phospholipid phosphatase
MPAERHSNIALVFAALVLCAIPLSILFADRPITAFVYALAHDMRAAFALPTRLVDLVEVFASLGLAWSFFRIFRRAAFGETGEIVLRASLATFLGIGLKDVLKLAFGRTWPETWTCGNPSFIRDGAFAFSPFHGGAGWASFPSGHMLVICAACGCLWALTPRLMPLCALLPLVVAIGLIGADYHFLSDILAGALVGWAAGAFVATLQLSREKTA